MRLIDKDELIAFIKSNGFVYANTLDTFPEVDAVRDKMRCENCRWFKENWCNEVMARPIKPTDFCSYFEKTACAFS